MVVRRVGLTLLVGAVGAAVASAVGFPGGVFTGAMLVTAAASLLNAPLGNPPAWLRSSARIILGLTVGATVTPETLGAVANALLPVAIMVVCMVLMGLGMAWALQRFARMSPATSLCGASPGALAAMVALADDLGGDPPVVASMHLVRLISVLLFMPAFVTAAFSSGAAAPAAAVAAAAPPDLLTLRLVALVAMGLAVGFVAIRLKMPAAEILSGLIVAAVLNPAILHVPELPGSWRIFAQWIVGAGVGTMVTRESLRNFRPYALAGGAMTLGVIAAGLGLGWILAQVTSIDLVTAIMGCSPGGADTLIILAGELGADQQLVAAMHVSRLVILMLLLPIISRVATTRLAPGKAQPAATHAAR